MGGARLAVECQADVIPIALNSGECWPRNAFVKQPGVITVSIGPLIRYTGQTPEQMNEQVQNWIEGEMRQLNPERYRDAAA